ncbi:methyltransferase [Nonomuraea endophytica]|uniref:methyltransferase n=1 Tax=Nonomuraea endophytica TaxID=714136 RepID=UPI0037CA24DB
MKQGGVWSAAIRPGALGEADTLRVERMAQIAHEGRQGPLGLRFDHVGLLVFPSSVEAALAGQPVVRTLPSVVVRERLARRYELDGLAVTIAHLDVGHGRTLELFLATGCPEEIADDERLHNRETHLAFEAPTAGLEVLESLRADGYRPDGGGFNPAEGANGRSVFYFKAGGGGDCVEIVAAGQARAELERHLGAGEERRRMLELLTGAWTTQALRTAAELGIADRLLGRDLSLEDLAATLGCPADRLARLVRYLEQLGVVASAGGLVTLTQLGATLARASSFSLHGVALLYGGLFYHSFGHLPGAVQTGTSGFELAYGTAPFDYLEAHADQARVFQLAMSDQCRDIFDAVAASLDLTGITTVTDIGGGSGALLGRILDAAPHVRGLLFDTPATVAVAEPDLIARHGDRITTIGGDLFSCVPGGDLLVLSRILHDWDDDACARILSRCRQACREGARLAIVERLLPQQPDRPSLATAWDVHMMVNNTGGRERTLDDYRDLLQAAGFTLTSHTGLPLEAHLLEAVAH